MMIITPQFFFSSGWGGGGGRRQLSIWKKIKAEHFSGETKPYKCAKAQEPLDYE